MASQLSGLGSAKLKLARARKHIKTIQRSSAKYIATRPYKITKSKGKETTQVIVTKEPPPEINILAGEVIYQIRSALDHLVFALIKKNPPPLAIQPDWERRCEFPFIFDLKGKVSPLKRNHFPNLPGISEAALTFIERIQPYYRVGATNNALWILGVLSNLDKHRRLNVVIGRIRKAESIRMSSGMTASGFSMLDSGTEFPTKFPDLGADRAVNVNRRYSVAIHFSERKEIGAAGTLAVDYLLKFILEQVEVIIIPAFEELL
ncbi:MAG TPA: hypothetical protein VGL82_12445 [Bryobacteraceae bacterium]|jgi:hypothetical protein